ncbi:hypothetical protein OROMI_005596 [Orobanche minor]
MESMEVMGAQKDKVRVKRKTLESVLQQCQWALQQLASKCDDDDDNDDNIDGEQEVPQDSVETSAPTNYDTDKTEFYGLLQSGVECADFLKKLENAKASAASLPGNIAVGTITIVFNMGKDAEEQSSWDIVDENDLWDDGNVELDSEDYVLVGQEDIMDGIASFMAAYLLSLKQTRDLSPNQLQAALSKTFSLKKKKGKLRKAWDGSKVIYNIASWGATAIGDGFIKIQPCLGLPPLRSGLHVMLSRSSSKLHR